MSESSSHETTEKRSARAINEISFDEIEEIIALADQGDEIAQIERELIKQATSKLVTNVEKALAKMFEVSIDNNSVSNTLKIITDAYIKRFNQEHGTDFENLDQIGEYLKENGEETESEVQVEDLPIDEILAVTTAKPKDYVHTLGKLTDVVFSNKVTTKKGQNAKFSVPLDKKGEIKVYVSVDYDKVLEDLGENAKVPELSEDDRQVLDGIVTNCVAGNWTMTYNMIYRGFSGKTSGKYIYVPDDIYEMIDTALDHFRGILRIDNRPEVEVKKTAEKKTFDGPILHFDRLAKKVIVNGKEIDGQKEGIIQVYAFPSLYRFAQMNGNEIDTRDIRLLDVPGINNTPENRKLKWYLYKRIITMRNNYDRNVLYRHKKMTISRKILLSTLFSEIGVTIDKSQKKDRVRKTKLIDKIEKILQWWIEFGLISGYEKTKKPGSREIDGIEISFSRKLEEKT